MNMYGTRGRYEIYQVYGLDFSALHPFLVISILCISWLDTLIEMSMIGRVLNNMTMSDS